MIQIAPLGNTAHLDDLRVWQAQLLVVIKHCVHVFDPDCIDWAVHDHPFAVLILLGGKGAEEYGQNSILPLLCGLVALT